MPLPILLIGGTLKVSLKMLNILFTISRFSESQKNSALETVYTCDNNNGSVIAQQSHNRDNFISTSPCETSKYFKFFFLLSCLF
jgi:hypothetical protein